MRVNKDYHIHTRFSNIKHAKNSVEEIIKEAINNNLTEIAITNHGLGHLTYGMREDTLLAIKKEVNEQQEKYPQIKIWFGVESNILSIDGTTDITNYIIENCDIILCGYHTFVSYKTLKDAWHFLVCNKLAKTFGIMKKKVIKRNTDAIVNALNKYKIDILTHPGEKLLVDIERIAEAAEKNGTILEISDSHKHLSTEEIIICKKYNLKYAINSDSHVKETIGEYEHGLKKALDAGLDLDSIINLTVNEPKG